MLNRVILIGRLTRDPELKYTPSGTAVATFTLAVNRKFNEVETYFIDVVVWRQSAEFVSNYGTKGRLAMVEGRLQIRTYETKEGQKRKVAEVVADDVRFLDKGTGQGSDKPTNPAQTGFEDLGKKIRLEDIDIADDQEIPY